MESTKPSTTKNDSLEDHIIALAKSKPDGISNADIQADIPDTPAAIWTKIINKFLKTGYGTLVISDMCNLIYKILEYLNFLKIKITYFISIKTPLRKLQIKVLIMKKRWFTKLQKMLEIKESGLEIFDLSLT